MPFRFLLAILLIVLLTGYLFTHRVLSNPPPDFPVETLTEPLTVDWTGNGPDFDPWNRCPNDFFKHGFILVRRAVAHKETRLFFLHRAKKLIYRIDLDEIAGSATVGLHWVTGTLYNAKYRIADPTFVGGKAVPCPTGTTTTVTETFQYGEAVSKRKSTFGRELFSPTHITTDNCPSWHEILNTLR